MPAEHVRSVSTQSQSGQERFVIWCPPKLHHENLWKGVITASEAVVTAARLTIKTARVMAKVWMGWTFGITAKTVSPTRPLELDATPDSLTGRSNPVFPTTATERV